ncbi:acyltransferase family protein [Levilactobacillus tujiorum]|uniref:acyltransferase family protein n=1 Tax=Levilactobacillus tujiorum TaxID=2912243 RepID=UPI0038CBF693
MRIISMFLIVLGHFAFHTTWSFKTSKWAIESSVNTLWIGGKLGVDLFVLISGYFLVKSRFKKRSLIRIWVEAYAYTVVLYLLTILFGINQFGLKRLGSV